VISGIAIWLLIRLSDWGEVVNAVSTVKLIMILPALAFFLSSIGLRALSWRTLLQNKAPYGRVFITINEGYLLNNILPFRLGELGRAFLLSQATALSGFFVLSTIVIERAYDLAIAAGLLLATLPMVLGVEIGESIAIAVLFVVFLGLLTMFILARNHQWVKNRMTDFSISKPFFQEHILPRLDSLIAGLGVLTRLDQFILSVLFLLLGWTFGAIQLYYVCLSFGVEVEFWWIGFILGVISLGIALPSAPAGLGVYEIAMVAGFSLLGVPPAEALGIAVISHLINIVITGFIGVYGIFRDGESVSRLYQRLLNVRNLSGVQ
jgi:uncharacterized protein (TIRG00374 family)